MSRVDARVEAVDQARYVLARAVELQPVLKVPFSPGVREQMYEGQNSQLGLHE